MSKNDPRLNEYLQHIVKAINDIEKDVDALNFVAFKENGTVQRSVIFSFIIIGEASTKIIETYPDFINSNKQISWHAMKGMRNHLAHGYFAINTQIVWNTIHTELPKLEQQISNLLSDL